MYPVIGMCYACISHFRYEDVVATCKVLFVSPALLVSVEYWD